MEMEALFDVFLFVEQEKKTFLDRHDQQKRSQYSCLLIKLYISQNWTTINYINIGVVRTYLTKGAQKKRNNIHVPWLITRCHAILSQLLTRQRRTTTMMIMVYNFSSGSSDYYLCRGTLIIKWTRHFLCFIFVSGRCHVSQLSSHSFSQKSFHCHFCQIK